MRPEARWYQERASPAVSEACHVRFILGHPSRHLIAGKLARFGELDTLRTQPCGEKKHQFLLLFRRQRFRRSLDFLKLAHEIKLPFNRPGDNRE